MCPNKFSGYKNRQFRLLSPNRKSADTKKMYWKFAVFAAGCADDVHMVWRSITPMRCIFLFLLFFAVDSLVFLDRIFLSGWVKTHNGYNNEIIMKFV